MTGSDGGIGVLGHPHRREERVVLGSQPHLGDLMGDPVVVDGGRARLAQAVDPLAEHPFVAVLRDAEFTPPDPDGIDRAELRALVRRGLVVEEGGQFFAAETIDRAAELIADLLATKPDGVTVSEVRQAMGATRKHTMPLLARLDATGVTRRRDDVRIAGPRLPAR